MLKPTVHALGPPVEVLDSRRSLLTMFFSQRPRNCWNFCAISRFALPLAARTLPSTSGDRTRAFRSFSALVASARIRVVSASRICRTATSQRGQRRRSHGVTDTGQGTGRGRHRQGPSEDKERVRQVSPSWVRWESLPGTPAPRRNTIQSQETQEHSETDQALTIAWEVLKILLAENNKGDTFHSTVDCI